MIAVTPELNREFARLIERARLLSTDVDAEIKDVLDGAGSRLLDPGEARELLAKVIVAVRRRQQGTESADAGDVESLVAELVATREKLDGVTRLRRVDLLSRNGLQPHVVRPNPVFHTREIPLYEGYVRTRDINLWDGNERLEIHLQQFEKKNGRKPNPEELLNIMLSYLKLEGVTQEDQFKIPSLARSIAANGLRKPPIIALDGRLLDGNRRIAACYYILNSAEFSSEQKQRVEYTLVWQLTDHATSIDEDAIIVSLNFEDDHKQPWPEYVKARKVYEEWEAAIALEPGANQRRQADIKREISKRFALGFDTAIVSRYIKMVQVANEFEDHHVVDRKRDPYAVKHKAAEYFQYFDELSKGTGPGGVAYELNGQPEFKNVVFELLYADKFKNWKQIRDLRHVVDHEEARDMLLKQVAVECKNEDELEDVQEKVESALALGRVRRVEQRLLGANTRIESFVRWLMELPVSAFRDEISPSNLERLHGALSLVDGIISQVRAENAPLLPEPGSPDA